MRSWGWFAYKTRDALYCPYCRKLVLPGAESGTFDFKKVGVPAWDRRETIFIDVECKAGNTSFPFNNFREDQHQWAANNQERPKWVWLCLGKNSVKAKKKPRRTYLFPYELLLSLERELERKSIPYACLTLDSWELEWRGNRTWRVPEQHPIRIQYHYL